MKVSPNKNVYKHAAFVCAISEDNAIEIVVLCCLFIAFGLFHGL